MKVLSFFLLAVIIITASLLAAVRPAEAGPPAEQKDTSTPAQTEQCLRKIAWLNLFVSSQLKARWFNILNFCYNGTEITDWRLTWRPRTYVDNWDFIRLIGPRVTGNPFRAMQFQTEAIFRGIESGQVRYWRPLLWQRVFPSGRWLFGGSQQYW